MRSFLDRRLVRCVFTLARAATGCSRRLGRWRGCGRLWTPPPARVSARRVGGISAAQVRVAFMKSSCTCSGEEDLFASKCKGSKQKNNNLCYISRCHSVKNKKEPKAFEWGVKTQLHIDVISREGLCDVMVLIYSVMNAVHVL